MADGFVMAQVTAGGRCTGTFTPDSMFSGEFVKSEFGLDNIRGGDGLAMLQQELGDIVEFGIGV
jgi:hypothetical protein